MCGINGFNFKNIELLKKMSKITASRGPDNEGFFFNENFSVGHNRLSIIDVEKRSNQPLRFNDLIISFNGEIYNYLDLKKQLQDLGYFFDTNSDTEVIIKLFDKYKLESFKMLSGIFAISIYDTLNDKIYLVRDVVGVKPIYYYFDKFSKKFYFSSLIKSLLLCKKSNEINLDAIKSYSNFNRNDLRETYFKGIFKVLPGEVIEVSKNNFLRKKLIALKPQKDANTEHLKKDINSIFSRQFLSDVPVALSLSGGIDSNIIFHELLKKLGSNFSCYSVTFENSDKYKIDHDVAKEISKKYGVKFNTVMATYNDFQDRAEDIVDIVEEPVGNTNSVANLILSESVKEKVFFSGDGGDEVFTGYNKYRSILILSIINKLNFLNFKDFKFNSKIFKRLFIKNSRQLYLSFSEQNLFKSQKKIYNNFEFFNEDDLNETLNNSLNINNEPNLSNVMYHDLDTWVVNDILLRNDKIYSNKGIEARVPFLDKDLITNYLMASDLKKYGFFFKSKKILKNSYNKELKYTLKKKSGFNTPFAGWLREGLFEFAKKILSKEYYNSSELINFDECEKLLKKHKKNYYDPFLIWNVINLQIFLRKFKI